MAAPMMTARPDGDTTTNAESMDIGKNRPPSKNSKETERTGTEGNG